MVALITLLLAIIFGMGAALAGLDFYQGFFAVITGLFVAWVLAAAGLALLWRLATS